MRLVKNQDCSYGFLSRAVCGIAISASVLSPITTLAETLPANGLVAHFEAESGISTDASGVITGWADQSGASNDLLVSGNPVIVTDPLNGQQFIDLDGQGDAFYNAGPLVSFPSGNDERTVFTVVNYEGYGWGGVTWGAPGNAKAFGLTVSSKSGLGTRRSEVQSPCFKWSGRN